jgi:hypothetical protein
MCYEDYRKAEDSKFGDMEDGHYLSAHDDHAHFDKENFLTPKVPHNTQNFNRRLGKDKGGRRRNGLGVDGDGR